jgi:DNA-binding NtrC family response regulator
MNPRPEGRLSVSEAMRQVEMLLRRVADVDSPLLITGESGVGKEAAARFVHRISTRADEPFVVVNCGAIANQFEGWLFGHEWGAFITLMARHHGLVEQARNGVLFLDEVGALPGPMQVKLLHLIRERTFTRVGGDFCRAVDYHPGDEHPESEECNRAHIDVLDHPCLPCSASGHPHMVP